MVEVHAKCEKCGDGIKSENVIKYSKEHYENHVYCYKCQRKKKDNPDWEYKPPEKDGADAKKKGTLDDEYSGGEVPNPDSEEIEDIDAIGEENDAELNAELNDEFTGLRDKMNAGHVEQVYEWLKSEYGSGTFDELSIEHKRSVIEQTRHLLQQKVADKVSDSKGEEVAGSAKVVDAEIVSNAVDVSPSPGIEERKPIKSVDIDEGEFLFQEDGDKLRCKDSGGALYELKIAIPDCSCSEFKDDKSVYCGHLKAAIVAGYNVAKLVEKKKVKGPEKSKVKEESVDAVSERKEISIDWKNIPKQIFVPKLVKALEYVAEWDAETDCFDVKKASGEGASHRTTLKSCDCADCLYRGTSLNPCVHQIRIKYSDDKIQAKLRELGAENVPAKLPKKKKDIVASEPTVSSDMMIQNIIPKLAEVGKIKIGGKAETKTPTGHLLPEKWDHFEIATLMKDDEGRLEMDDELNEIIGKDCKSLDIYLCYDSPSMNIPTYYSWFAKSKLVCMGNGVVATKTQEDGSKVEKRCNPKECPVYANKKCKPYGRLSVILADSNRIGGVYVFRTTSWNSLRNILSSMSFIRTITGGVLAGLPLTMRLLPMSVVPKDLGRNVKIYVVNIEFSGAMQELQVAAKAEVERRLSIGMNMRQIESENRKLLADQVREEAEEEAEDIAAEFAPNGE